MNKKIKGYLLHCNKTKYPIGIETPVTDINDEDLLTGDTVLLNNEHKTVVCTAKGDIMGIWGTNQNRQNRINEFKVKKIKSYKNLKNGEEFEGYDVKVVLENTNENHVENIKHIINGNTSIVILENGSKGIAKCHPNDKFDKKEGLIRAYARANGEEIDRDRNELKVNEKLWNDIINNKAVINCETKEDVKILFNYLKKKKIKWWTGRALCKKDIELYDTYKNFCIEYDNTGIAYQSKDYFLKRKYKIITFKELFNPNPLKQLSDYTNEELLEELENRLK
ncbi:hypothetical protein QB607_003075 [Clostridium botulinum]|nr:hypothetical protein [Clostridium botulinum]EKS4395748.1 hypothetical protein [Clostridium botulinum]